MYGILISVGILLSLLVAERLVDERDTFWGLSFWTILGGVLGSRLYHVADYYTYYAQNPIKILFLWEGGLGIIGAIVGGTIATIIYLSIKRKKIKPWLDVIATVTPLGQSIGRWGNYFNKEIHGSQTNLPWGIYSPKVHPLFLYESILDFGLFILLYWLFKKRNSKSNLEIYLILYATIRLSLEPLRMGLNTWEIRGVNVAQIISLAVILLVGLYLIRKSRK